MLFAIKMTVLNNTKVRFDTCIDVQGFGWFMFNAKCALFCLCHGENTVHFDDINGVRFVLHQHT